MTTQTRTVACPTCRIPFPAGKGPISVCPHCAERVLVPSLDGDDDNLFGDSPSAAEAAPAPTIASVPVVCKLCNSRFYARPSQIGDTLKCPDCHTENMVESPPPEKPAVQIAPLDDDDDFRLSAPVDTPQYRALAADALEFERAIRSGQLTNAAGAAAAAESKEASPEVPKPGPVQTFAPAKAAPTKPVPRRAPTISGSTPLASVPAANKLTAKKAPVKPPAAEDLIELFPEDDLPTTVASRSPSPARLPASDGDAPAILDDDDAPFNPQLSEVVPRPEYKPVTTLPKPDRIDDDDYGANFKVSFRQMLPKESLPPLPPELAQRRPFSTGIVSFLLQPSILTRWVFLSLLLSVEFYGLSVAINGVRGQEGAALAQGRIVGLIISVTLFIPGFLGALSIAANSLTILEDTANGQDRIESWSSFLAMEWMGGVFYVLAALFLSGLPVALLTVAVGMVGIPAWLFAPLLYPVVFLLFPPILLSILEADSVSTPLTKTMLQSFVPLAKFWGTFYGLTMAVGFVGIVALFSAFLWPPVTILPCAVIITALPFIYFRLLGRMAMMYRDYIHAVTGDEAESDVNDRHIVR